MEPQLVAPRLEGLAVEDGAVHSAVRIGGHGLDVRRGAVQAPQLDAQALRRPSARRVKDVRRQTPHIPPPLPMAGLFPRMILGEIARSRLIEKAEIFARSIPEIRAVAGFSPAAGLIARLDPAGRGHRKAQVRAVRRSGHPAHPPAPALQSGSWSELLEGSSGTRTWPSNRPSSSNGRAARARSGIQIKKCRRPRIFTASSTSPYVGSPNTLPRLKAGVTHSRMTDFL